MKDFINLLSITVLSGMHLLIVDKCIKVLFGKRKSNILTWILWIAFYSFITISMCTSFINEYILLFGNLTFIIVISSNIGLGSVKKKILFSVFICAVWMMVEVISYVFAKTFPIDNATVVLLGDFISKILMIIIISFFDKIISKKHLHDISIKSFIIVIFIPGLSVFFMAALYSIADKYHEYDDFLAVTSILLLIVNYVIIDLYEWMSEEVKLTTQNKLFIQQIELCSRQNEENESMYQRLRILQHDIKNHLTGIRGMIDNGRIDDAKAYIGRLLEEANSQYIQEVSKSGNIVIDSLINYKYSVAEKNNIRFISNIHIPSDLPFDNANLTIILGNLLENAIEATNKLNISDRFISVEIIYGKGILKICIKNSCLNEKRQIYNGSIITTKSDKLNHGMGIISAMRAAEKYDGHIELNNLKTEFIATVILYEKDKPEEK